MRSTFRIFLSDGLSVCLSACPPVAHCDTTIKTFIGSFQLPLHMMSLFLAHLIQYAHYDPINECQVIGICDPHIFARFSNCREFEFSCILWNDICLDNWRDKFLAIFASDDKKTQAQEYAHTH